ncbi:4-hydroxy-tetrahydrodipicolinate reductase [Hutsoniella sourekii]
MKVILIGLSGAMGQEVARFIETSDHELVAAFQEEAHHDLAYPVFNDFSEMTHYFKQNQEIKADVVIDFSHASLTEGLMSFVQEMNLPIMLATTGQSEEQIQLIKEAAQKVAIVDTHNTSIGVTVMTQLVKSLSQTLYPLGYDIELIEKHHRHKKDAPSGTAVMLLKAAQEAINEETHPIHGREGLGDERSHQEIGIHAVRAGDIVGEHTVLFANNEEVLEVTHRAGSKQLFVKGSIQAAEFLSQGQAPGLYSMEDVLNL